MAGQVDPERAPRPRPSWPKLPFLRLEEAALASSAAVGRVVKMPRASLVVRVAPLLKPVARREVGPLLPTAVIPRKHVVARVSLTTMPRPKVRDTDIRA